jgi:hypothetical protein
MGYDLKSGRELSAIALAIALNLTLSGCSDDDEPVDIEVRRLLIVDNDSVEIENPKAGQHAFLQYDFKCYGTSEMVQYVILRDGEVEQRMGMRCFDFEGFGTAGGGYVLPEAGDHLYELIADPDDLITEENEENNVAILRVTVAE